MEKLAKYIKLAIIFPYALIVVIVGIFKSLLLGHKEPTGEMRKFSSWDYALSLLIYISILGYIYYNSQFYGVTYVYACPNKGTSKCYKVTADIGAGRVSRCGI